MFKLSNLMKTVVYFRSGGVLIRSLLLSLSIELTFHIFLCGQFVFKRSLKAEPERERGSKQDEEAQTRLISLL